MPAGTVKYYAIHGERRCPSVHLGDHRAPDRSAGQRRTVRSRRLDLMAPDGDSCTNERGCGRADRGRNETATAVIDGPTFGAPDTTSYCPTDGVAVLEISRIGQAWADQPLQVEIVVRMEPAADAGGLLPQASKGDPLPMLTHGAPTVLTGGTGFNDAPRLTSGVTYQDTIATGESSFYRVPQQWGQRFSYLVTEVGPAQPPLGVVGSIVRVDLFNPVRADITGSVESTGCLWFTDEPDKPFSAIDPVPGPLHQPGGRRTERVLAGRRLLPAGERRPQRRRTVDDHLPDHRGGQRRRRTGPGVPGRGGDRDVNRRQHHSRPSASTHIDRGVVDPRRPRPASTAGVNRVRPGDHPAPGSRRRSPDPPCPAGSGRWSAVLAAVAVAATAVRPIPTPAGTAVPRRTETISQASATDSCRRPACTPVQSPSTPVRRSPSCCQVQRRRRGGSPG